MIHVTDAERTSTTWYIINIVFIRHLFNREIKKQGATTKNIQTLSYAMTLTQEAMQIGVVLHSEVLAVQQQSSQPRNKK